MTWVVQVRIAECVIGPVSMTSVLEEVACILDRYWMTSRSAISLSASVEKRLKDLILSIVRINMTGIWCVDDEAINRAVSRVEECMMIQTAESIPVEPIRGSVTTLRIEWSPYLKVLIDGLPPSTCRKHLFDKQEQLS